MKVNEKKHQGSCHFFFLLKNTYNHSHYLFYMYCTGHSKLILLLKWQVVEIWIL